MPLSRPAAAVSSGMSSGSTHQQIGLHGAIFGIGAGRHAGIADAVADEDAVDAGPDIDDHAGALQPRHARRLAAAGSSRCADRRRCSSRRWRCGAGAPRRGRAPARSRAATSAPPARRSDRAPRRCTRWAHSTTQAPGVPRHARAASRPGPTGPSPRRNRPRRPARRRGRRAPPPRPAACRSSTATPRRCRRRR